MPFLKAENNRAVQKQLLMAKVVSIYCNLPLHLSNLETSAATSCILLINNEVQMSG